MFHSKYLSFVDINKILKKANMYLGSNTVKSMTTFPCGPLHIGHLISIILYCDYSDLSRDFKASFRKSYKFQLLSQIRRHNSEYYWWSKTLKEAITEYGQFYKFGNGMLPSLQGPFYCGMSVVLNVTQFIVFMYCPLSTSVHLEVETLFSGEEGMVVELNNNTGSSKYLHGMDVSWLSRYREEDERYESLLNLAFASNFVCIIYSLFFGCQHYCHGYGHTFCPLTLSAIRIIPTATKYQEIIQAMMLFDGMLSGKRKVRDVPQSIWSRATSVIGHLLANDGVDDVFDSFIYRTFNCFLSSKHFMKIHCQLEYSESFFQSFAKLIFG